MEIGEGGVKKVSVSDRARELFATFLPSGIRLASAGFQFLSTILIARILGEDGSAVFFFWSAIMVTAAPIASFGLEQVVLRDMARLKGAEMNNYLRGVRIISLSLAGVVGLLMLVYGIVSDGWEPWLLMIPIGMGALSTTLINGEILKGLSRPVSGILCGHFIPVTLFFLLVLIFGWSQEDSVGIFLMWVLCFVASAFLVRFCGESELAESHLKRPAEGSLKKLFKESFPVFGGSVFGASSYIIPLAILKECCDPAEVSYATTAFRISILFIVLSWAIHSVFAPEISRASEANEIRRMFRAYGKAIVLTMVALAVPLFLGIVFPRTVMSIFGENFREGAIVLRLFLIVNFVSLVLGPVMQLLVMTNNSHILPRTGVVKITMTTLLSLWLVPNLGGIGLVIAMGVTSLLEETVALAYILLKIRRQSKKN